MEQILVAEGVRLRAISASAFGEECITTSGTNRGFGAMEVLIELSIDIDRLDDEAALGIVLGQTLDAIDQIPLEAPRARLALSFNAPDGMISCSINAREALAIYRQGIEPALLFQQVWTCPATETDLDRDRP